MPAPTYVDETGGAVSGQGQFPIGPSGPVDNGAPAAGLHDVTPDNAADLPGGACRALLVTAPGNLEIVCADGSAPTVFPVAAGFQLGVSVARVKTGTTATVKAFYGYAALVPA